MSNQSTAARDTGTTATHPTLAQQFMDRAKERGLSTQQAFGQLVFGVPVGLGLFEKFLEGAPRAGKIEVIKTAVMKWLSPEAPELVDPDDEDAPPLDAQGHVDHVSIAALVDAAIRQMGITQTQVAKETGISTGTLNPFLKNKYPGDVRNVAVTLWQWLKGKERKAHVLKALPEPPTWFDTYNTKRLLAALEYAQMAGGIAVEYGDAGNSKTYCARRYADEHPNVWIVTANPIISTKVPLLEAIAMELGVRGVRRQALALYSAVINKVTDSGGLLIIDEAQHLRHEALETIRAIHDQTGVGLAFIGNDVVYHRISGGSRQAEFAQLFSRVDKRVPVRGPRPPDIENFCDAWKIGAGPQRELIGKISGQGGGIRQITKVMQLATMYALGKEESLAHKHIEHAARQLGVNV